MYIHVCICTYICYINVTWYCSTKASEDELHEKLSHEERLADAKTIEEAVESLLVGVGFVLSE